MDYQIILKIRQIHPIFKYNLKQYKQTIMNINFGKGGTVIYNMKPDFYYY